MSDLDLLKGPALAWSRTFETEKQRLFGKMKPVADALKDAMSGDAALANALAKHEAVQRMLAFAMSRTKSVMELADYFREAFSHDRSQIDQAVFLVERKVELTVEVVEQIPTGEVTKVPTGEVETVPTGETEIYSEEVMVKPGGFLRKAVVEKIQRTRPVFVSRPTYRDEPVFRVERRDEVSAVRTLALVNAFGQVKTTLTGCWVEIPPGTFQMGEPGTAKKVTITRPFKLLSVPMTQALNRFVVAGAPSRFKGDTRPVQCVSWFDAVKCCNAFSSVLGLPAAYRIQGDEVCWEGLNHPGVRLPTEAEWEYACRAGTTGDYAGNLDDMGGYDKNSEGQTHPVAQKQPNAWGLYDMHGNVSAWCWDRYGNTLPGGDDPIGSASGSFRLFRGGSWYSDAGDCRAAHRYGYGPMDRYYRVGFRSVLPLAR